MNRLTWEIKEDGIDKAQWFRAEFSNERTLLYKKFGKTWGSEELTSGIDCSFSISPIKTTKGSDFQYMLLISGLSDINGHIYLHTIDEGKKISEEILEFFLQ